MGDADITLRHISRRHAEALARPYVTEGAFEVVGWDDTQVTAGERRLDKTLLLRFSGELHALEIEFEYRYERDLPDRVHEYQGLQRMAFRATYPGRPPPRMETVVILLTGRRRRWPEERTLRTGWRQRSWSRTHFRIDAIYQRTVAQLRARSSPFWLAFAPLAVDADVSAMRRVIGEIRTAVPNGEDRWELLAAMRVMADVDPWRYDLHKEIEAMIQEEPTDLINVSRTLRTAYERGQRDGMETAIEKMLRELFAKRLHRALTAGEQQSLDARARSAPDEAQEKLLALEGEALAAWLQGPDTR